MTWLKNLIPKHIQETLLLRAFGIFKIPLLFYIRIAVVFRSNEKIVVKIPLKRRNKNHLNSMYLGVLCSGADVAAGLLAVQFIQKRPEKISVVLKDINGEFLKRVEGDAHFTCVQGNEIRDLINTVAVSEERVEMPVTVTTTVPSKFGDEPVAKFNLTLSAKKK